MGVSFWSGFMGLLSAYAAEDVDRILGGIRPTTCILDLWPSWLIKLARMGLTGLVPVINSSLMSGVK